MNLILQPPPRQQSTRICRRVFLTFMVAAAGVFSVRSEPETNGIAASKTYLSDVGRELQKSWPTNRTINIVCDGHSVPAGYFRTPQVDALGAYPNLLRENLCRRFPHAVINVIVTAIGGENSEQGAKRFELDVLSLRPDVVTIDYALNDRRIGLARADVAWRKMIEACCSRKIPVLLLTPTADQSAKLNDPSDPLNQHADQIRRLAAEYHVGLVDSFVQFKNFTQAGGDLSALMSQSNHPNRKGHELVAAEMLKWFPESAP